MTELDKLVKSLQSNIVSAELTFDGQAELFFRSGSKVESKQIPFRPFFLLEDSSVMAEFEGEYELTPFNGEAKLNFLVEFSDMDIYNEGVDFVKKLAKSGSIGAYSFFTDFCNQILVQEQSRFYRGLRFEEIRRLQFDLETLCSPEYDFPNAKRAEDEIIIISISDNHGYEQVLSQQNMSEKELIETFINIVQERDPDVIEGHNIFRFDLPYLETRAKRYKLKLELGRNRQEAKKRNSRFMAAERTIDYPRYDIYGRSVVDTMHLAQFYDVIHRSLESLNLKYLAKHFGFASAEREYVDGREITPVWHSNPDRLLRYALDDVRECRMLADKLLPSYFYMTQLIPMKLQDCVVRGRATLIDHMLTASYIAQREALPLPEESVRFAGALTVSEQTGVFHDVFHCDVRSLYPSIILANNWSPKRDSLQEFLRLLTGLREFRLAAKDAQRSAETAEKRSYYQALQSTFKILINSFYGYLGAGQSRFNDYAMAEGITTEGRRILQSMLDFLSAQGCKILEADTDGVYFVRPNATMDATAWQEAVQEILPAGISVELDEQYKSMFCYKSKNYALLSDSNEVSIAGAGLKSRGLEPFQRRFMESLVHGLLTEEYQSINHTFGELLTGLENGTLPTIEVAKSEVLKDSLTTYKRKIDSGKGRRSAVYELAMESGATLQAGDQLSFYVIGEKKTVSVVGNSKLLSNAPQNGTDYNRAYYLKKLNELYNKFVEFIPETERWNDSLKNNHSDDMFGF